MKHDGDQADTRTSARGRVLVTADTADTADTDADEAEAEAEAEDQRFPVPEWSRYTFVRFIASGGMGRVYQAIDPRLERPVALKFLRGEPGGRPHRLLHEARAQARLAHEHVCEIYEVGEVDGLAYIAMQFVNGRTLKEARADLGLEQRVRVIMQVAAAIHEAHRAGLIHRDLKPTNIMVERSDDGGWKPYVMDFGLARAIDQRDATTTVSVSGTPHYMAPEQVQGPAHRLDRRTDVYSLGATLYELLCGQRPFEGATSAEVLVKVASAEVTPLRKVNPALPADLGTIVMKCLEREPQRRYDSARALAEDLERFLAGEPILARPRGLAWRAARQLRKHRLAAAVALCALCAVAVLGVMWLRARRAAGRQAAFAQRFAQEVERVEGTMRYAHMLPLHDVRREKRRVAARLDTLAERVRAAGPDGEGPGHHALGRGYLALGELDRAVAHLEQARGHGQGGAELAFALGRAHGLIYERELALLAQLGNRAERDARRAAVEAAHRAPALRELSASAGAAVEAPELVDALIAFYGERYEPALAAAERAFARVPWLYEARLLAGSLHVSIGNQRRDGGDLAGAAAAYRAAEQAYRDAVAIGASDPEGYEGLCRLWADVLFMDVHARGGGPEPYYQQGVTACGQAVAANPDRIDAHTELSRTHKLWASYLMERGGDPAAALDLAEAAAAQAVAAQPADAQAVNSLGNVHRLRADWQLARGLPADAALGEAVRLLTRACELAPGLPYLWNNLGNAHAARARSALAAGGDPRAALTEAMASYRRAIDIDPRHPSPLSNLGTAYRTLAAWQLERGDDAGEALDRAAEHLAAGLALNPSDAFARGELAGVALLRGRLARRRGTPPAPHLAEARRQLDGVAGAAAARWRGELELDVAAWQLGEGVSPAAALAAAAAAWQEAARLDPGRAADQLGLARGHLLQARARRAAKADPAAELAAGRAAVARALAMQPGLREARTLEAELAAAAP